MRRELGKFKVPTLRNVDLRPSEDAVKAYGHNGYFKSLEDIVFFYHWRAHDGWRLHGRRYGRLAAMMGEMFPAPEVDQNRAAMSMFPRPQVANVVAFLKTLSDGYPTLDAPLLEPVALLREHHPAYGFTIMFWKGDLK